MQKPAATDRLILDVIKQRWSPYLFADKPIDPDTLATLFEASRWAASSYNDQPWRFIVATRDDQDAFDTAVKCLVSANQTWAKRAGALVFTVINTISDQTGNTNRMAEYDMGQAAAHLALQATNMGLYVHQMGGIDRDAVRSTYDLPDDHKPMTGIAIGHGVDSLDDQPEELAKRDQGPRKRHPLGSLVFAGKFGQTPAWLDE